MANPAEERLDGHLAFFAEWTQAFLDRLSREGVAHTDEARMLIEKTLLIQVLEGPTRNLETVRRWLDRLPLDGVVALYCTKYNRRKLTFNRCIRLLSDLHDVWLDMRQAAV